VPLKSEALPTQVSVFTDKYEGFQVLVELIRSY